LFGQHDHRVDAVVGLTWADHHAFAFDAKGTTMPQ
jgi:predicted metal-dependent enzyme (double-stranded beta helix superfamily)